MRTSIVCRISCLAATLLMAGATSDGSSRPQEEADVLGSYESWKEMTNGPAKVLPRLWVLCVPEPPPHPGLGADLQAERYIRVYANDLAAPAFSRRSPGAFPVGARLAKVKLIHAQGPKKAVAIMIKREKGFAPQALDWEFQIFEGSPLRRVSLSKNSSCAECHGRIPEVDGVFASYLGD